MKMKKQLTNRILSLVLTFVMVISMLPLSSLTALAADDTYDLWVGGEQFTSEKLTIKDSNGGTAKFDPVSNTLTLTNYNFKGEGYDVYEKEEYAAIYYSSSDPLNLVLEGTSSVTQQSTSKIEDSYGILSSRGSITVWGSGSLTATGGSADILSCGVCISDNDFIVSGGMLTAKSGTANNLSHGLWVSGNINISDGTIEANGGSADVSVGMRADDDITVSGGSITATGGVATSYSRGILVDSITVSDGRLETIGGDAASESYGVWAYENITVSGGSFEAIGGDAASKSYGVQAYTDITISGGTVEAFAGTAASISVGMTGSSITVSDTASLTAKSGDATGSYGMSYGVVASQGFTVLGGETIAQGKKQAFYSKPIVDSAFKYAAVWAGTDEFSAIMAGERPIDYLGFLYSHNYVKIAEGTPTATYTVETYTMGTDGKYGEPVTETKTAAVDSAVSVTPENKQGFDVNAGDSILNGTVAEDGSTVLKVYYNRNQYPVTFHAGEGTFASGRKEITIDVYFGAIPTAPETPALAGCTFTRWEPVLAPVTVEGAIYWAQFCDHSGSKHTTTTDNGDETHSFTCTVCDATVIEAHTGGTATCTEKAVCTVCGESYGELDSTNHDETVGFDENGFCDNCDAYEPAVLVGNYYEIGNAGQLFWFAQQVNSGNGSINGKLTADIDLESRAWTPITNFSGTFDGAGHAIKNFAMNITDKGVYGLFGFVKDATIKDFTIYGDVESTLTAKPDDFKYGVIADATGDTTITDVHSYVNFTIKDSYFRHFVGGILGRSNNAGANFAIERCSFSGKLNLGSAQVDCTGGIVAYVYADNTVKINNCLFDGEIISTYNSTMQVGGLLGYYRGSGLTVTNSLSIGGISVSNKTYMGALIGILRQHSSANQKVTNNYYLEGDQPFGNSTNSDDITDSSSGQKVELSATAATDAQLKSGEVAYLLQDNQESHVWGQTIGTENYPVLKGEKVYKNQIGGCCEENYVYGYANTEKAPVSNHIYDENGACICGDLNYFVIGQLSPQIRFGSDDNNATYNHTFDVRTRAKIADEDFAKFIATDNETAEKIITKAGFVYSINPETFSIEDAKIVAQGGEVAGYTDAPINYIQDADGYYTFTCIVIDIPDTEIAQTLVSFAYICVEIDGVEYWYFMDTQAEADFNSLYTTYIPMACEAYGWESLGDWKENGDGTHSRNCGLCGKIENGDCVYDKYVNNEDGTHDKVCSLCGYIATETHTYNENGTCTICGDVAFTYDSTTNTYTVYTADGLYAWGDAARTDLSTNLVLAADITLTGANNWTPVGGDEQYYTGTVDGDSHTITGLRINSDSDYQGFIGILVGTVKNLTFADAVVSAEEFSGIVVGGSTRTSTIENCHVISGSLTTLYGYAGCIAGDSNGTIISCTNAAAVTTSEGYYVGGITGYNRNGSLLIGCINTGTISGYGGVGGVSGINESGIIIACCNEGTVTCTNVNAGGIVGNNLGSQKNKSNVISSWTVDTYEHDGSAEVEDGRNGIGADAPEFGIITSCYSGDAATINSMVTDMNEAIANYNASAAEGKTCPYIWQVGADGYPTLVKTTE